MADSIWISTDGNLNAAGSYSPSGIPGAAGNIAFDGSSDVDVSSGLTALSAVDLTRIWTQPGYDGDVGASGNPLTTAVRRLIVQGSGSFWYAQEDHATYNTTMVDSPNQQDAFTLVSTAATLGGLYCLNGGVDILSGAGTIAYFMIGSRSSFSIPLVTVGTGVTVTNLILRSGSLTTKSVLGSTICVIDGGTLISDASMSGTGWSSVMHIAGGTVQFNSGSGVANAASQIIVSSGTLDMTQDTRAKTIARLILLPGANFLTHDNITVTTLTDLRGTVPILP